MAFLILCGNGGAGTMNLREFVHRMALVLYGLAGICCLISLGAFVMILGQGDVGGAAGIGGMWLGLAAILAVCAWMIDGLAKPKS